MRTDFSESPRDIAAIEAARRIEAELLEKHGLKMTEVELFAGLCDLSYVGGKCSDKDLAAYKATPAGGGGDGTLGTFVRKQRSTLDNTIFMLSVGKSF